MRVVFAGTPEFAVPSLQALCDENWDVVAAYTQPDRPAGRGRKPQASPVKRLAQKLGIPVHQPVSLKPSDVQQGLASLRPGVVVVAAYGLLLPPAVLEIPEHGCINVHASLLPRWRGAAPIQRAILAGDRLTGITIMRMAAGLDEGDMLCRAEYRLAGDETGATLHDGLAALGARLLPGCLRDWVAGRLDPVAQDAAQATYAAKLTREEGRLDWSLSAEELARAVRAYNPWPGAFSTWNQQPLKIWEACVCPAQVDASPGQVVAASAAGIDVATGRGVLRVTRLQLPGKRAVGAGDFCNGRDLHNACFGA